jgi:3-keto-disaccharide hydrolase
MSRPLLLIIAVGIAAPAPAQVPDSAWTPLFNGRNLDGWTAAYASKPVDGRPASALFTVENGMIHVYANDAAGSEQSFAVIESVSEHRNYRISLEYKWGAKKFGPRLDLLRDAGLLYHKHGDKVFDWPPSVESQIQEGDTGDLWAISSRASSTILPETSRYAPPADGGVPVTVGEPGGYGRVRHGALNELPEWNTVEVIVRGDTATHIVNGFINMRVTDLKRWDPAKAAWVRLDRGKIALQAESAEIYYRNIRIRPLTAEEMK